MGNRSRSDFPRSGEPLARTLTPPLYIAPCPAASGRKKGRGHRPPGGFRRTLPRSTVLILSLVTLMQPESENIPRFLIPPGRSALRNGFPRLGSDCWKFGCCTQPPIGGSFSFQCKYCAKSLCSINEIIGPNYVRSLGVVCRAH